MDSFPIRYVWNRAWLLLIGATILFGLNGVASRLAVHRISPMSLVLGRWLIVCTVLAVTLRHALRRDRDILHAHRWRILAMGGLGFTAFNILFYLSAYWTTALNITLMQASVPPFVLLGAIASRRMRVTPMQIAGLAVTLVGVALIATHGELLRIGETQFNPGDLLMLAASVLYAGYTLALHDRPAVPPLVFFAALTFAALSTSIPAMATEIAIGRTHWPTLGGLGLLIFVALGPSLTSQILYMRGIELIGPARAGLCNNLTPIFGAFFAVLLLGEDFHIYHAVALALALGGIWLAESKI